MGTIFRAEDLQDGTTVALKLLTGDDGSMAERFLLEARTLASLDHPAIVKYLAHGRTDEGRPYLAMQWLDGADLARVLQRGPLSVTDTLTIVKRVAEALSAAHERGIVHRDLKPANIVLIRNDPKQATVVDFGVARPKGLTRGLTRTGAIVGTVGYMSAEQLQGVKNIDGRADLFALGCVAFECITGRAAFAGDNIAAVLAQVLLGETPHIREHNAGLSVELDAFVATLMHSDREQRFASAFAVIEAADRLPLVVDSMGPTLAGVGALTSRARPTFAAERSPVAVLLCWAPERDSATDATEAAAVPSETQALECAEQSAVRWDGAVKRLADGAMLLAFSQGNVLTEKVARCARAALELHDALPHWGLTLSVMQAESSGQMAGRMRAPLRAETETTPVPPRSSGLAIGVTVQPGTESLLGPGFDIEQVDGVAVLTGFSPLKDEARPVLGQHSPCVGREKELQLIEATVEEVVEECAPRAVLLVAPPGVGKSRVRREVMARLEGRPELKLLLARCDVGTRLSSFAVIQQWLQGGVGRELTTVHDAKARWELFRASLVDRVVSADELSSEGAIAFLGELAGISAVPANPAVAAVAGFARETWHMLTLAMRAWLRGQCKGDGESSLVLIIEDLHWADASSVALVSALWEGLTDVPVFLLATSWPEGESYFPAVFAAKNTHVVKLEPLGKRASERMARQLLGAQRSAAEVQRVVELAGGNAFLLEEISRHVAENQDVEQLPTSAVALVQARLQALSMANRRLLRVASVIGESFAKEAIAALCQLDDGSLDLDGALTLLRQQELIVQDSQENRWSFRHSLIRQAAYESLTESDRLHAHVALAEWLIQTAPEQPAIIAEHFERGDSLAAAAEWYLRAIEQSERQGHYHAVRQLAARCDRAGIDPDSRAHAIVAWLYAEMSLTQHVDMSSVLTRLAAGEFARHSSGWFLLTTMLLTHHLHAGIEIDADATLRELLAAPLVLRPSYAHYMTVSMLAIACLHLGRLSHASEIAERLAECELDEREYPLAAVIRDSYVPIIYIMNDDPRALTVHRRGWHTAKANFSGIRLNEIGAPFATFAIEFGAFDEAREVLQTLRANRDVTHGYAWQWALYAEAKLATQGDAPWDARGLLDNLQSGEMMHVELWLRAFATASAAFADPSNTKVTRETFDALELLLRDCERLPPNYNTTLALIAEVAVMVQEYQRCIDATDSLFVHNVPSPSGLRSRMTLARLRSLKALGRKDECEHLTGLAKSRLRMIAAQMEPTDRENFEKMRVFVETMAFES